MYKIGSLILGGKFVVEAEVGSGTFGMVLKVRDTITGEFWAVKRIFEKSARESFEKEVKLLHQLKDGPHILPYHDYAIDAQGTLLIFTRFMDAGNLHDRIRKTGKLADEESREILRQMAEALRYAQSFKPPIQHKDIKPENILGERNRDDRLSWYLADWGLAEAREGSQSGILKGTLPYIAPEVFRGRRHQKSDMYSLGMTFYYMLCGKNPFDAGTMAEFMYCHLNEPIVIPDTCSPLSRKMLLGMLEKEPEKRWGAQEVINQGLGSTFVGFPVVEQTSERPPEVDKVKAMPEPHEFEIEKHATAQQVVELSDTEEHPPTEPPLKEKPTVFSPPPIGERPRTFTNSIGMKFVPIPAGSFMMGSPREETGRYDDEILHKVTITKPFYMQTTQVTQRQWQALMEHNPSRFNTEGDDCPVERLSWDDAQEFIEKLNKRENTDKYRLPTEAEWEYSCRAGSKTKYCFGDDHNDEESMVGMIFSKLGVGSELEEYAWYKKNSEDMTLPVAQKKPNDWGLYDMHGNVYEWCQDIYGDYSNNESIDPEGASEGDQYVLRGGSWDSDDDELRSADRRRDHPYTRKSRIGFRLARDA
jgi:formylglycine-generating enzyme required for sulfatase activity